MGEEVVVTGLRKRISKAFLLAFAYIGDKVAGVAGLKNPYRPYKRKIFMKAGLENRCNEFDKELGWVFVVEEHRRKGISKRLVKARFKEAGGSNIFATSMTNNVPMQKVLMRNRFAMAGKPFISSYGNQVRLFLHYSLPRKLERRGHNQKNLSLPNGKGL